MTSTWGPGELDAMDGLLRALFGGPPTTVAPPVELVRRHHLGPLAHALGLAGFRDDYAASAVAAARRTVLLAEIGDALASAGIAVAPIKGAALVPLIYPDPALRPMHDVDLLVPIGQLSRAIAVLRQRGFARAGLARKMSRLYHATAWERRGQLVELHRNIVQAFRTGFDLDEVWGRADRRLGSPYLTIDLLDQLLVVLLHIARHELALPAIAYLDVARLLAYLGPGARAAVLARAARYRAIRPVTAALAMTDWLARGASGSPRAPAPAWLMPSADDVRAATRPRRARQIAQKLALTDGPREALGLGVAWVGALLEGRWRGRR